jgi:uncharacterized membrane protein (DUF106 family)
MTAACHKDLTPCHTPPPMPSFVTAFQLKIQYEADTRAITCEMEEERTHFQSELSRLHTDSNNYKLMQFEDRQQQFREEQEVMRRISNCMLYILHTYIIYIYTHTHTATHTHTHIIFALGNATCTFTTAGGFPTNRL